MKNALRSLKKHIVFLSFTAACSVILIMLIVLNVAMSFSYSNRSDSVADLISQAAFGSVQDISSEEISLSEVQLDSSDDYIMKRNPLDIKSITLYGKISCERPEATWYSAGGGIVLKAYTKDGKDVYFYQEYSFNKDVNEITIDFPNLQRMKTSEPDLKIEDTEIAQDVFMISKKWWAASENGEPNGPDVSLDLQRVCIKYKDNISISEFDGRYASVRNYSSIFNDNIPEGISGLSSFYLITDKNHNLIEINTGNLINTITNAKAHEYLESGSCVINGLSYESRVYENAENIAYVFLSDSDEQDSLRQLKIYSICLGLLVAIILMGIIYFFADKMVAQIASSYDKQNQFISNASHELKTPITVISATADILVRKNGNDKWLETIKVQSDKMQRLVSEMLELTKMNESVESSNSFKVFDLSRITENTVLYFESRAYEEHRNLISDIEENISFNGCEEKIEELIGILLDNALKYSDENGTINLTLESLKNNILLKCSNPCKEFNAENTDRLFERFYRSDESHSDEKNGFGLGLSIAQLIVLRHKGKINVSYENNIVSFNITFPKH